MGFVVFRKGERGEKSGAELGASLEAAARREDDLLARLSGTSQRGAHGFSFKFCS